MYRVRLSVADEVGSVEIERKPVLPLLHLYLLTVFLTKLLQEPATKKKGRAKLTPYLSLSSLPFPPPSLFLSLPLSLVSFLQHSQILIIVVCSGLGGSGRVEGHFGTTLASAPLLPPARTFHGECE